VSRKHDVRYVYVLYDIQPDVAVAMGFARLPAPAIWEWHCMNQYILKRAGAVVVPCRAMADTLVETKGVPRERTLVIPNLGKARDRRRREITGSVAGNRSGAWRNDAALRRQHRYSSTA